MPCEFEVVKNQTHFVHSLQPIHRDWFQWWLHKIDLNIFHSEVLTVVLWLSERLLKANYRSPWERVPNKNRKKEKKNKQKTWLVVTQLCLVWREKKEQAISFLTSVLLSAVAAAWSAHHIHITRLEDIHNLQLSFSLLLWMHHLASFAHSFATGP